MAIVTDQTITIHGVSVGISKPIQTLIANGDFTYSELSKFAFVGRYDFVNDVAGMYDSYSWSSGDASVLANEHKFPVLNDPAGNWDTVRYVYYGSGDRKHDNYGKMVLVYNMVSSDNVISASFNDGNEACIVTEINPRLLKIMGNIYPDTVVASVGEAGTYTIYDSEGNTIVWYDDDTSAPFRALEIQQFDDKNYYVFPLYNNIFISYEDINGNKSSTNAIMQFMIGDYAGSEDGYVTWWKSSEIILNFMNGADYSGSFTGVNDLSNDRSDVILTVVYGSFAGVIRCRASSQDTALKQIAGSGLYFEVNNVIYKPIAEGGVVTGYTADLTKNSEWDLINDVKGNTVPDTPGGGGGGGSTGDDMEAMATGATGSSGGFTHFYVMSSQNLIDFLSDFFDHASSGETLTNNLVCSYILGIPSSEFCATESVPIAIHNSAQGTPFVSQANYSHITATNNLLVVGSFNVPRMTNTFYDFAPYSTYEVFIPCCGWVPLPDTVAGRTINVEMYIDIASCCLKAAVKTDDLGVCAVANGVLGAAIPIAVIESGILRGNNIQAGLGIIGGGINTGVGAGSGNAMGIGFGVQQILSGLVECTVAGNTNYTQQKGGTGDITQFAMGHKCYMKVTHPDIDPVVNNSIFGHSVGYLCNSIGKLSSFKGFTVCGNPHVTFSASAEEREEIERLLSMGVIL